MKNIAKRNLQEDARRLLGFKPYGGLDPCAGDVYFANNCSRFWGDDLFNKTIEIEVRKYKLESTGSK